MVLGEELTEQLRSLVCASVGACEGLNPILHWLVQIRTNSEVTPAEVSWETPQLDGWTHSLATGKIIT